MSKNFEKEYMEYLNAQAPDLWNRIEAGVDALEKNVTVTEEAEPSEVKVVPISGKKSKKGQKKRRVRYQHYRMIASVAACLFALVIIVPVYLLTGSGRKNEKAMDLAPQMVENVTIQNLVVDASESEMAESEAEPAKEVADGTTEIEVASEMMEEEFSPAEDFTAQSVIGIGETDAAEMSGSSEKAGQLAGPQESGKDEDTMNMLQEEEAVLQEEMMVTVLGEGAPQEDGVMYAAVENGSGLAKTVSLFVPASSDIVFAADGEYVLTVQISQDGSYYEVLAVME